MKNYSSNVSAGQVAQPTPGHRVKINLELNVSRGMDFPLLDRSLAQLFGISCRYAGCLTPANLKARRRIADALTERLVTIASHLLDPAFEISPREWAWELSMRDYDRMLVRVSVPAYCEQHEDVIDAAFVLAQRVCCLCQQIANRSR